MHNIKVERFLNAKPGQIPFPSYVQINTTQYCNIKCEFCWQRRYDSNREEYDWKNEMSHERLLKLVDECAELGVREILISGNGEPMTRPNTILEMMKKMKGYGIVGGLTTNGTLFTEEITREIVRIGYDRINVSLQAHTEELQDKIRDSKGSLKRNMKFFGWLKKWKEYYNTDKPVLAIAPVTYSSNYDQLLDLFKFAKEQGVSQIFVTPIKGDEENMMALRMTEKQMDDIQAILPKLKKYADDNKIITDVDYTLKKQPVTVSNNMIPLIKEEVKRYENFARELRNPYISMACYEPWTSIVIHETGTVAPCCETYNLELLTNVKKQSLKEIWYGKFFNRFRKDIANQKFSDLCKYCGIWRFKLNESIRNDLILFISNEKREMLKEENRLEESYELSKRIYQTIPDRIWHVNEYLMDLIATNRFDEAKKLCEDAKELFIKDEVENLRYHRFKEWLYKEIADWSLLKGNIRKAMDSYRTAKEQNPFDCDSDKLLSHKNIDEWIGNYYFETCDYELAAEHLKKAFSYYEKDYKNPHELNAKEVASKLGDSYFFLKKPEHAIPFLQESLKGSKDDLKLPYLKKISECYIDLNQHDHASRYLDESIELLKTTSKKSNLKKWLHIAKMVAISYWNEKKYLKAIGYFEAISRLSKDKDEIIDALIMIGQSYWLMDRFEEAAANFEKSISIAPKNLKNLKISGLVAEYYFSKQEYDTSIKYLQIHQGYSKKESTYPNMLKMMGESLWHKKEYGKAKKYFIRALSFSKDAQESLRLLKYISHCSWQEKKYADSVKYYNMAFRISEDRSDKYILALQLARALRHLKQYEEAIINLKVASKYSGNKSEQFEILKNIGECHIELGNLDKAHEYINRSKKIATNPTEKVKAINLLGKCYWYARRYNEAIAHYKEANNIQNNNPEILRNIGECLMQLDKLKEAEKYLSSSIKLDPDDPWTNFSFGKNYWKLKDVEASMNYIKKAMSLGDHLPLLKYHAYYIMAMIESYKKNNKEARSWLDKTAALVGIKEDPEEIKFKKKLQKIKL